MSDAEARLTEPETVPRYTLEEARRVMAARDCSTKGHDLEVVLASGGEPARLYCRRGCGTPGWVVGPVQLDGHGDGQPERPIDRQIGSAVEYALAERGVRISSDDAVAVARRVLDLIISGQLNGALAALLPPGNALATQSSHPPRATDSLSETISHLPPAPPAPPVAPAPAELAAPLATSAARAAGYPRPEPARANGAGEGSG